MGILDNVITKAPSISAPTTPNVLSTKPLNATPLKAVKPKMFSDEMIETELFKKMNYKGKKVCMVLGEDGVGKTGLVLDYLAKKLKADKTANVVYVDLDDGASVLVDKFHKEVADQIRIIRPIQVTKTETKVEIAYKKTVDWISAIADYVDRNLEKKNIIAFVFDGLSTLLTFAERQMRIEKNINADGGVNTKFWLIRNKVFEEMMMTVKQINCDSFFIGHTDFVLTESSASIKIKTNAMMYQRIICKKEVLEGDGEYKLVGIVNKAKGSPLKENSKATFMQKKGDKFKFDTDKIFEGL